MKEIINQLYHLNLEGNCAILVTIVNRVGSSPRGTGSCMVVSKKGYICGTIGGGMLEYHAIQLGIELLKQEKGLLKQYRLRKEKSAELGMICGGNVDILFTILKPTRDVKELLERASQCLHQKKIGCLLISLDGKHLKFCDHAEMKSRNIPQDKKKIIINENSYYVQQIGSSSRVFIFGGGHLAQELVPVIDHLGFRCIVTDDRAEYATKELFPQAEEVYVCDYTMLEGKYQIFKEDYIIVITRGHLGDFHVQEFALKTSASYIGVVGSKNKIKIVNQKLLNLGFSQEDLDRITAPIGIDIKSETPAEIAISIAAQLILIRAKRTL